MSYHTTVRESAAIKVAALAHRGDYAEISRTFQALAAIAADMRLFGPATRLFAIYYDNPSTTPKEALRSDACLTAPEGWSPDGRLEQKEIRGGRYAVTIHIGPYTELQQAYQWLYGTWLAQSGEAPADQPLIEEYLNDARTVPPGELKTEIWLPLR
jgi:AraC family transcriptional regulator